MLKKIYSIKEYKPQFHGYIGNTVGLAALALSVVLQVVALKPGWFSTPEVALNRYILTSLLDFKSKDELAYSLASLTNVSVVSTEQDSETFTANLRIVTPVVPFGLTHEQVNTHSALRKFNALPPDQELYATLSDKVVLRKSGLGWIVAEHSIDIDPVNVSRAYLAGDLPAAVMDKVIFPINAFGALDYITRPFNLAYSLMVSILFLVLWKSKTSLSAIDTAGPPVALYGAAVLFMSYATLALPTIFFGSSLQ